MTDRDQSRPDLHPASSPEGIEAASMAIIEAEVPEPRPFQGAEWLVARRMIHTSADFELLDLVRFHPRAVEAGLAALRGQAVIVTDTRMALAGMPARRLDPLGCRAVCLMEDEAVKQEAARSGLTRARVAVDQALERLRADIFVIGNAPTALIRLLERIREGAPGPALIVGMPVGFVNAAESKELLMAQNETPYVTIAGRKGGSALAATVINALADMALAAQRANA